MSMISGNVTSGVTSYSTADTTRVDQKSKSDKSYEAAKAAETSGTSKTSGSSAKKAVSGKTIGNPQLSEKAAKYYETLKKKYAGMDFILVSEDQKVQAQADSAKYANANKTVVLIDEDKIERMAEDENYRKKYESIIANASSGIAQLKDKLAGSGANVKTFGMQINDNGTASYFAVLEKSSAAQKDRIEKKAAQKKADKKAEEKKKAKEAEKEQQAKRKEKRGQVGKNDSENKTDSAESKTITITASSIDELLTKINDKVMADMSDSIQTDEEKARGQKFDFSI